MKWSWKFVRIAGIDIYIHVTFFLLIYLVGISYWNQEGSLNAVIAGVGFILALFACVVMHEFGHCLEDHFGLEFNEEFVEGVATSYHCKRAKQKEAK